MTRLESGSGNGNEAKVGSDLRLYTQTVSETESAHALDLGNAYNINTGVVSLGAETGMLYIKNNEDKSILIDNIIIGMGASATYNTTSFATCTVIRNPTTGTLIESTPTNVDMIQNRNFGTSNSLTADAYKAGASADTITNGDDIILIALPNAQSRTFAQLTLELKKGNTIGVKIDPNLASGTANCYVAIVCHLITQT